MMRLFDEANSIIKIFKIFKYRDFFIFVDGEIDFLK